MHLDRIIFKKSDLKHLSTIGRSMKNANRKLSDICYKQHIVNMTTSLNYWKMSRECNIIIKYWFDVEDPIFPLVDGYN